MSLVVARLEGAHLFIISDTHLTDPRGSSHVCLLEGVIKTTVVTDTLSVSFSGSLYWAEVGLGEIDRLKGVSTDLELADIVGCLLRIHRQCSSMTDFLIGQARPIPTLIEIKNGGARSVTTAWIGSAPAFERFQGSMMGALQPFPSPANAISFEAFQVPEPEPDQVSETYFQLLKAMQFVIDDESVPEVGGFVVPVGLHQGRLEYMNYATVLTHPIRFDQMPETFTVPFGTAEQGGYAFNLMSERTSSTRGLGAYVLQGRYGVVFTPKSGVLKPSPIRDMSPLEFEETATHQFGVSLGCMYTQPKEHCERALIYANNDDLDAALDEANKAVTRSFKIPAGFRCRGIVHAKRSEMAEALKDFSEAILLEPKHAATLDNRGLVLAQMGCFQDAYADFSRAIQLDGTYVRAFRHRAMAARELGRLEEALADEATVYELNRSGGDA